MKEIITSALLFVAIMISGTCIVEAQEAPLGASSGGQVTVYYQAGATEADKDAIKSSLQSHIRNIDGSFVLYGRPISGLDAASAGIRPAAKSGPNSDVKAQALAGVTAAGTTGNSGTGGGLVPAISLNQGPLHVKLGFNTAQLKTISLNSAPSGSQPSGGASSGTAGTTSVGSSLLSPGSTTQSFNFDSLWNFRRSGSLPAVKVKDPSNGSTPVVDLLLQTKSASKAMGVSGESDNSSGRLIAALERDLLEGPLESNIVGSTVVVPASSAPLTDEAQALNSFLAVEQGDKDTILDDARAADLAERQLSLESAGLPGSSQASISPEVKSAAELAQGRLEAKLKLAFANSALKALATTPGNQSATGQNNGSDTVTAYPPTQFGLFARADIANYNFTGITAPVTGATPSVQTVSGGVFAPAIGLQGVLSSSDGSNQVGAEIGWTGRLLTGNIVGQEGFRQTNFMSRKTDFGSIVITIFAKSNGLTPYLRFTKMPSFGSLQDFSGSQIVIGTDLFIAL